MYDDFGDYDDGTVVRRIGLYSRRKDRAGVEGDTGWFKPMDSLYIRCVADKGAYWTDAQNYTWRTEDMTTIHRQNLVAWLERRADALHQWAFENGKISYDDRSLSALEWLNTLPLLTRLHELTYCATCGRAL